VCHEMQQAVKLNVPLIADCGIGTNWLEAHWWELRVEKGDVLMTVRE
jgi:hypothetical protein